MTGLLLAVFLMLSLSMVVWGLSRADRYYQLPMLTGAVWLLYIGPMAIGIYNNRNRLPDGAEQDNGITMALFMSILCCLAICVGYFMKSNPSRSGTDIVPLYNENRVFICGVLLLLVGYAAFFQLTQLSGGVLNYFSLEGGGYQLEWTGLPVAYHFFSQLIYPGLILCLFAWFNRMTLIGFLPVAAGLAVPLANVILRGRRSELAALLIVTGFSIFFRKKIVPARIMVMAALCAGALAILVAPVYREYSQLGAETGEIWNISPEVLLTSMLRGDEYTEFHYPVIQLPATMQEGQYNYGRGFYNRIVHQWVPKLLTGTAVKDMLFLEGPDFNLHTLEHYGWLPQNGWIPTAIVDVFREFGFYGAALFIPFAMLFRGLWNRAVSGDAGAQIFYISLAPSAMYAIVSGLTAFAAQLLYLVVFLMPVLLYCRTGHVKTVAS